MNEERRAIEQTHDAEVFTHIEITKTRTRLASGGVLISRPVRSSVAAASVHRSWTPRSSLPRPPSRICHSLPRPHFAPMATPPIGDGERAERRLVRAARRGRRLILLLLINLFNYVDRQVLAAVEQPIGDELRRHRPAADRLAGDGVLPRLHGFSPALRLGSPTACGRWVIVGVGVPLEARQRRLGAGGDVQALLIARAARRHRRGRLRAGRRHALLRPLPRQPARAILAWFYVAIPVGSAGTSRRVVIGGA